MSTWLDRISPRLRILWRAAWKPGNVEPARFLYDHELVIVTEGSCLVQIEDQSLPLTAGHYVIIPPGTHHVSTAGPDGVFRSCMHFHWQYQTEQTDMPICCFYPNRPSRRELTLAPSWVPKGVLTGTFAMDGPVCSLVETLFHRWQTGRTADRQLARATFLELIIHLVGDFSSSRKEPSRADQLAYAVKEVLEYDTNSTESIQALLSTLGFSYAHLCRVFHGKFGVTPGEYRNATRLERAKALLANPRLTVSEVAYATGFQDPGYFARKFRQHNKVSPGQLR